MPCATEDAGPRPASAYAIRCDSARRGVSWRAGRLAKLRASKLIPSMYQRRLLLIGVGVFLLFFAPLIQVANLTLARGEELREQAEKKLVNERWIRTIRGTVYDRKGRVLAKDQASFEVAVDYSVLIGQWAYQQATRRARRLTPNWSELAAEQRQEIVQSHLREFESRVEMMWDTLAALAGVSRAEIEQRRESIIDQVRFLSASVTEAQRRSLERELAKGEALSDDDGSGGRGGGGGVEEVRTSDVRRPIREEQTYHVVLRDVPDSVGFKLRQLIERTETGEAESTILPGLHVLDSVRREYPLETIDVPIDLSMLPGPLRGPSAEEIGPRIVRVHGVATHVLGWMRGRVYREDSDRREAERTRRAEALGESISALERSQDRGRYLPNDLVGASGLEYAMEFDLRGSRGVRTRHLDTGEVETTPPSDGRSMTLTIDAMLQARLQALFDPALGLAVAQTWHSGQRQQDFDIEPDKPRDLPIGTPLNGAIAVIDVKTGDVLSLVSAPSFSRERLAVDYDAMLEDRYARPLINRAVGAAYAPGSIVKPLVLCGAHAAGKVGVGERIDCVGHFFPDKPLLYRCWIYKQYSTTHTARLGHEPDNAEAVMCSCNIYFFEMGRRLGQRGVYDLFTKLGVGPKAEHWNLAIGPEFAGALPKDPARSTLDEAILMGIGQGPIAWTPLHAADAYATLARGGVRLMPRMRVDDPIRRTELGFSPQMVQQALEGLRRGVSENDGTTHHVNFPMPDGTTKPEPIFDVPGITIWAKSGTADVAPFKADLGLAEGTAAYDGDHAWCVFLAGVGDTPEYAVAVVVDHGGSGGRCAGPIANQVVRALVAEGYLPNLGPVGGLRDAGAEGGEDE